MGVVYVERVHSWLRYANLSGCLNVGAIILCTHTNPAQVFIACVGVMEADTTEVRTESLTVTF